MGRARGRGGTHAVAVSRRGADTPAPYSIPDLKIQYDDEGRSIGRFEIGSAQKETLDLVRNACTFGGRALVFHGPKGSGKTAMSEQFAAIMRYPLVAIDEPQGEAVEVWMRAGNGYEQQVAFAHLDREQIRALESLGEPKVLAVRNQDADLQAVLSEAVRADRGTLQIDDGDGVRTLVIHPNTAIVFEVEGESFEDNPCLRFEAIADTTPLIFSEFSPEYRALVEAETLPDGSARAEPEVASPRDEPDETERIGELAHTVAAAVEELEAAEPRREALIDQLQSVIGAVGDPGLLGEGGRAFIERAVTNFELQAFLGDNRADRTVRLQLQPLFPRTLQWSASDWGAADQNRAIADVLPPFQAYCDAVYGAGTAWREKIWGQ